MDLRKSEDILQKAFQEGRFSLSENEVYSFFEEAKLFKGPERIFIPLGERFDSKNLSGNELVLKVQHPKVQHKTELGGVQIVDRENVNKNILGMLEIRDGIEGVLVCEKVEYRKDFGQEILLGMRKTREFGPVITFGIGGIQTELLATSLKPGLSSTSFCLTRAVDNLGGGFSSLLADNLAYGALTGKFRGGREIVSASRLDHLLQNFMNLIRHFSSENPSAKFHLEEFEINPLVVSKGDFVALDGILKFSQANQKEDRPPLQKVRNLLYPKTACVLGVSEKGINPARQILRNLLEGVLGRGDLAIIKNGVEEIDGVKCYASLSALPVTVDLLVIAARAEKVPNLLAEAIDLQATESILLISGGLGEKKGGESLEAGIREKLSSSRRSRDGGPVMVGGNSLGIISQPGGINTLFVPESKLPHDPSHPIGKNVAILSQSGAFAISRMSKLGSFCPQYMISTGNQIDLGLGDFLAHFIDDPQIKTIACYVEGFKENEGFRFAQAAEEAKKRGKETIVYKIGRSQEGREAATGHTAAIAGDWIVAREILTQAGCLFAETFEEFTDFLMLSSLLSEKEMKGMGLAAISNAGFETVGMSDHLEDLKLVEFKEKTSSELIEILRKHRLADLQDIRNPMDLTPMATDKAHLEVLDIVLKDPNVHIGLHAAVPLTPAMKTRDKGGPEKDGIEHPDSFACGVEEIFQRTRKPFSIVVDSGGLYDPMANKILETGIPVFRSADRAVRALSKYARYRLRS